MKHKKSVQIIFLSSVLSFLFSSEDVFAYKESDLNKFKNTKKCIECDLTDLNLSRVNLSRVNLSGSNLKEVNLTYANLSEIIIDIKALSTLVFSESTFLNKSTLAEETKKEKEQALRKKKEEELSKKKEEELRKKDEVLLKALVEKFKKEEELSKKRKKN